VDLPGVEPGS